MNDDDTLYEVTKENTDVILLPKNKNNPEKKYTTVLIWLAGLDESSDDFIDMFIHNPPLLPHPERNKIIILCGEKMKVTAYKLDPSGDECNSWFDMTSLYNITETNVESINLEDLNKSTKRISEYIEKEAKYLNGYDNIFLGGFSQGAIMSLHVGLSYDKLLGGIICCSGALFPKTEINKNNENVRIFVSHGDLDNFIEISMNKLSIKRIKHFPNLELHYYPSINHCIEQNALMDLANFFYKYMK